MLEWEQTRNGRLYAPVLKGDVGWDMAVGESWDIYHGEIEIIDFGFKMALPDAMGAIVLGRSSMTALGVFIFPTLIDPGYRGPMKCFATMMDNSRYHIDAGDRVAQIVPFISPSMSFELKKVDKLTPSDRGEKGFGSTGK